MSLFTNLTYTNCNSDSKIWQGINIDIVQIVANVSLLPNNVTPTDISYLKKKQYISIHFDNKMTFQPTDLCISNYRNLISILSNTEQFIFDNTTSISQSTYRPVLYNAHFHSS